MRGLIARMKSLWFKDAPAAAPLARVCADTPGLHRLFPENPMHLAALAASLFGRGLPREAAVVLEEAKRRGFSALEASALYARHQVMRKEFHGALETLAPALAAAEPPAGAYEIAGAAHFNLKNIPQAYRYYGEAVRIDPANPVVRGSFAGVCDHHNRFEQAIEEAKRALRFDPRSAVALKNLSIACGALARLDEEQAILELGRLYHPTDTDLELQLGFFKLRAGDYREGWPLYEARLRTESDLPRVRPSTEKRTRWDGRPFPGKTLLIFGEQGFGDNIMVARLFPEVKALGGTVVLEARPPLAGLLARARGLDSVVSMDTEREPDVPYDMWIPSMSLPMILGFDPGARTPPGRYLGTAGDSVDYWRERTAPYPGRKVGIAWSGNPQHKNDSSRSIPFELVRPLFNLPGCSFFSLQLSAGWGPDLHRPPGLVDFTDELLTFDDTAGLADCMDLVISVDTSVAHVGGALGRPTWILVPYLAEWRWGLKGERTHWYESASVLRQPRPGDWGGLLRLVRERLEAVP